MIVTGIIANDVVTTNGSVHNNAAQTKNNHKKTADRADREKEKEKPCVEAEHKTLNNNKAFSHTNGDIHTEVEFIERVGSVLCFNRKV